jgi:hypothetical protein
MGQDAQAFRRLLEGRHRQEFWERTGLGRHGKLARRRDIQIYRYVTIY